MDATRLKRISKASFVGVITFVEMKFEIYQLLYVAQKNLVEQ